jgi:preprotein translocase subunit YajC
MTSLTVLVLLVFFDALLILFWVLVRLDRRRRREMYNEHLDALRNRNRSDV